MKISKIADIQKVSMDFENLDVRRLDGTLHDMRQIADVAIEKLQELGPDVTIEKAQEELSYELSRLGLK